MRYTYARFKNYIPFYNGLGLHELEIDFSSSKNHIVVISGINGCGKSSLLKMLNLMPDPSDLFIEGLEGEKELHLIDEAAIYHITIRSPITKSGRGTTKVSILKDGVELNPNGNVGSYKEIIFSEFDLSPNFVALTRLSSTDRGLADKLPSERKKFMSAIIDSLEVYNDIYKELNKKATIFRSYVNNLHTKIQSIGDEKALSLNLSNLVCQLKEIRTEEDRLKEIISAEKAKISIHDPDGNIQDRFLSAEQSMKAAEQKKSKIALEFERSCASLGFPPSIEKIIEQRTMKEGVLENINAQITKDEFEIQRLTSLNSAILMEIERIKLKIDKMESEIDPTIFSKIDDCKKKIEFFECLLIKNGLVDRNASVSEIQLIQKYMQKIMDLVDQLYQDSDPDIMKLALDPDQLLDKKRSLEQLCEQAKERLFANQNLLKEYSEDLNTMLVLADRPNKCRIPSCPFVASALQLKEKKYKGKDINKCINDAKKCISETSVQMDSYHDQMVRIQLAFTKSEIFSKIQEIVSDNTALFYKTECSARFEEQYEKLLKNWNPLTKYRDVEVFSEICSLIIKLNSEENKLNVYNTDFRIQKGYAEQVDELSKEYEKAIEQSNEYEKQISTIKKDLEECQHILSDTKIQITRLINLQSLGDQLKTLEELCQSTCKEYEQVKAISISSIDSFNRLGDARRRLEKIQQDRAPMESAVSSLQGQLSMLDTYKADYMLYDKKFKMVDLVRKYTSPSKGGIQSLFIQLYMSKTLELANQLLQMLFAGEYRLLDFVIDSNEFRIPFIGSGMMVDDISSGSTSQICIIGSIINLVLLYQASSKYNIPFLDEIDSGLDQHNRVIYGTEYLYKLVSLLGIEQLFVISHSAEVEMVNVDIIRLRQHNDFDVSSHKGNVIYDYSEEIKTFE